MNSQHIEPRLGAETFSCPHCNAVAHHDWYRLFLKPENATEVRVLTPAAVTVNTLRQGEAEQDDVREIDQFVERLKKNELTFEYQKHPQPLKFKMANLHVSNCHNCNGFAIWVAGRLVNSPRESAALMRVCIQKLVPLLKQEGKSLNDYMSSLVRKGLEVEIRQAVEVLQVLRNETGQPTSLETQEDKEMALRFFDSLKAVLERRMLRNQDKI